MDWKAFKEDPHWLAIVETLEARRVLIRDDLGKPEKTATLLDVRRLQQELDDIFYMSSLPDIFTQYPDREEDGVGTNL